MKPNHETIYLVPTDYDGGQLTYSWCDCPAPGEGMDPEDAIKYVRADLVPASNEVLARRIVELTNERDAALAQLVEVQNNCTGVSPCERFCEALATKKMFDNLQSDNRQLKAQVEQLREVLRYADNKLYILTHNRKDVSPRLLTDADKGYKAVHEAVLGFEDNLNVFVAKRDAEIKAQAVRDFIQWGIQKVDPEFAEFADCAEHYISTELSQQAKAGE